MSAQLIVKVLSETEVLPKVMLEKQIRLERFTRREFREARGSGQFRAAIIATGSIEQHLEHLALEQDIASSAYVAERVAERLHPSVIVAVPMAIGISEHHMAHPGTLTAKPGSWLAVLFDTIESLVRHGVNKVLVLNGHGGNVAPVNGVLRQWRLHLDNTIGGRDAAAGTGEIDLRFHSYWDVISPEFAQQVLETDGYPSHAKEFETAFMMHIAPNNVRHDAIPLSNNPGASAATADKGRQLAERAVDGVSEVVEEMLQG